MKQNKTLYRVAKGFIIFFMFLSIFFTYINKDAFTQLGFPEYFRIELIIAKFIGVVALMLPATSVRVKEWVYAGFMITMISALIAHICSGDPIGKIMFVAVDFVLVLIAIRYVSKKDLEKINYKDQ